MRQLFQRMIRIGLAGLLLLVLAVLALRPLPAVEPAGRKLTRDGTLPNAAGRRLALVVGNARYKNGPLDNPEHDAEDMSKLLREIGFGVTALTDVGLAQMRQGFEAFARDLRNNDEVIVYYSGHGVQYDGHNFLVPVDAAIARTDDLEQMTLSLDAVIEATSARKPAALVIVLDACRDRSTLHGNLRGLAEQRAAPHMLLAFATSPGTTASDGWGRNGLYTKHLLKHLGQPGATVEEVFKRVRLGVMEESEEKQVPMESSLLVRNLVLVPSAPVSAVAQSEAWMAGANESQLRTYLAQNLPPPARAGAVLALAGLRDKSRLRIEALKLATRICPDCPRMTPVTLGPRSTPGLWVGTDLVTPADYQRCVQAGACPLPPLQPEGPQNMPLQGLSLRSAQAYVDWLNTRHSGYHFHIPSWDEWEATYRHGYFDAAGKPYFGNALQCEVGNFYDVGAENSGRMPWRASACADGFAQTAPAGMFWPTPDGLFDLVGNLWQWTSSPAPGTDGKRYRLAGGSWATGKRWPWDAPPQLSAEPELQSDLIGLRVYATRLADTPRQGSWRAPTAAAGATPGGAL